MPFKRPTLSELRDGNRKFMQAELENVGALLRFANLKVLADMDAGMGHLHYAYLDYIALQTNPFTSTDEYLAGWMALKQVFRKPAAAAKSPAAQASGSADRIIPAGSIINRGDVYQYRTDAELKIQADGFGVVAVTAILPDITSDVTGGGARGNADAGTIMTLDANIAGVDPKVTLLSAATGGADIETEEDFRSRGLLAWQNPPQGGSDADYKKWALEVSGVTRAWVKRRLNGAGTVGVYIMCDRNDNGGFPVGTDGISQLEDWGAVKATGDQLAVADHIYPQQTGTAIVFVCSPIKKVINIEISGIKNADSTTVQGIKDALTALFFDEANPDGSGKVYLSDINGSIGGVSGTTGYILNSPTANITFAVGEIPVLGGVNFV
ncbi:baseplate J/gp47 family protein [Enterobacter asburiae]|uniref:baseplate J/gp47 family protein n=1 Tax=Enterobacter asburiae TaxID=61645 RepID=UPI0005F94BBD|nr:baseplate J/gp47 family protein [Enterobacter asburiae]KJW80086.1 phage baseplate J-like protein [Enterobacter asburiae]KJX09713.1 phage baseplate J-like protein [Enterobacter asburiae]